MSKYSRIRGKNTTILSNSLEFSDQSFHTQEHSSSSETPSGEDEHGVTGDAGEVFGVILSRKFPISDSAASCKLMAEKENVKLQRSVKKSFSMRRSISLSELYSRIHDQHDISVEDDNGDADTLLPARPSKRKANIFRTCRRFFSF